jgi:hypothetical protein
VLSGKHELHRNHHGLALFYGFIFVRLAVVLRGHIRGSQPDAGVPLHFLWFVELFARLFFVDCGITYFAALFLGGLATWFVMRTNLVGGCSRIARGEPLAGSVTGGEACGYRCSEKEGFNHSSFSRAPFFWGTYE